MHSLNVVMISAYQYPRIGGSEKQLLTLAKALKKKGIHITILTQRYARELLKHDTVEGVTIHRLPVAGSGIWASISFMISLCCYILKNRKYIDIIHVSLASSPAVAAIFVGWIVKKKIIVKLGGGSYYGDIYISRKTFLGNIKLFLLRKSDAIFIAVSSEISNELLSCGFNRNNIVHIPNGVDRSVYHPVDSKEKERLRESLNIPVHSVVFIFSGRLVKGKNIEGLLNCWIISRPKMRNMYLLIIGDGHEKENIDKKIENVDSKDTISIRGFQDNIHKFYQCSDIFISLSVSEGLSNSILEAMACGLPVITASTGGIDEVMRDKEEGFIIRKYGEENISKKIVELAEDKIKRKEMGSKARDRILKDYTIQKITERYEQTYNL